MKRLKLSILFIAIVFFQSTVMAQSNKSLDMNLDKVVVEIWSDVVCPFCLIGKKKMEHAITKYNAQDKVEVVWRSFQLDPDFPMGESLPSLNNLSERKGYPLDQVKAMSAQLAQNGRNYGIDFQFDKALTFNTLDVHRLIQWSKILNKSNELKEAFMIAYFTNGVDLSKTNNVLAVIDKLGLDKQKAQQILSSDAYTLEVHQDIAHSRQLGVRGVPYFLIDQKEAISVAQADAVFENAIKAAIAKLPQQETTVKNGGVCLPSGECD
jgi:predicted DsbA family dithiol-disulfide isomerase